MRRATECLLWLAATSLAVAAGPPRSDPLEVLSAARPDVAWRSKVLTADLNCDSVDDHAVLGVTTDKVYVGVLLSGRRAPQILEFPIAAGAQDGVCSKVVVLALENLDYDPVKEGVGALEGFRRSKECRGLRLEDDECDAFHFYWNAKRRWMSWWRR